MKSVISYFFRAAAWAYCLDPDQELLESARNGWTPIVKALLDAGADVHKWDDAPLRWSAENGHTNTVKTLLEAGANPYAWDVLARADKNGHTETARVLREWMERHPRSLSLRALQSTIQLSAGNH